MNKNQSIFSYAAEYPVKTISLEAKQKIKVRTYPLKVDTDEDFAKQLEELNSQLKVIHEKHYSSNATEERILNRGLFCLIQTVIYEYKRRHTKSKIQSS